VIYKKTVFRVKENLSSTHKMEFPRYPPHIFCIIFFPRDDHYLSFWRKISRFLSSSPNTVAQFSVPCLFRIQRTAPDYNEQDKGPYAHFDICGTTKYISQLYPCKAFWPREGRGIRCHTY